MRCSALLAVVLLACTPAPAPKRVAVAAPTLEQKPVARTIHPQPGNTDCIEMYGSCTPPPDQLCTSNAFVLACGETGELPSNGERIACACP